MFLELVDSLRCVRPHEDSWLVARADVMDARHIIEGQLGCPVCAARYPIHEGIADFSTGERASRAGQGSARYARLGASEEQDTALRAAALLGLTEAGGTVVLLGSWASSAEALLALTEGIQLFALNADDDLRGGDLLSIARIGVGDSAIAPKSRALPIADASMRGFALDEAHATPALIEAAVRTLVAGGRLIAPAGAPVPDTLQELARDERHWVAAAGSSATVSAPIAIVGKR